MELVQANPAGGGLVELEIGTSKESFLRFLDSQKELFHSQIDQLQKIVVTQCNLTGVNPLSQEMAAGALSIKIGKKPRDLLNPKAIKYMQSVFSIKDTISKKEIREISALCGVTITQVRDFFSGQRSRVRKLVRLSREKAIKSDACKASSHSSCSNSDNSLPVVKQTPENSTVSKSVEGCTLVPVNTGQLNSIQEGNQAPVKDIKTVGEGSACSLQEESIPGVNADDKKCLEDIFNLMRSEKTFSGQVKLMEWVLQIHDSAVLHWFLTKGGIMIYAEWLSQAALEEQTTVLLVIFKVLSHLPLHKALPVQMSAILQAVNKLRFYRTSDISNKARVLLSRWSKMFVRSQTLKRPSSMYSSINAQKEMIRKQRINEILSDGSWQSKVDIPEDVLALAYEGSENSRRLSPKRALKLLASSSEDSTKKHGRSVSSSPKIKERRKVLLVEQPDYKNIGRTAPGLRAVPANNSRPISADDIQKAKMRAIFMQSKYGKIDTSDNENRSLKSDNLKISITSLINNILPISKLSQPEKDEIKNPVTPTRETPEAVVATLIDPKPNSTSQEPLLEKLKGDRVPWQMPQEMRINSVWRIGTGENSKEVEVQTSRIRREKETFYPNIHDIPSNPKEPWDMEMDYDDSLTPEIPTEQPPDAEGTDMAADGAEASTHSPQDNKGNAKEKPTMTSAPPVGSEVLGPDLELLAVLLKNPELVFALTSGKGSTITDQQTVALLDVLKKSNGGLTGIMNGLAGNSVQKPEPTSLPSPTPLSEQTRTGWRSESAPFSKNPPLQPNFPGGSNAAMFPGAIHSNPSPTPNSLLGRIPGMGSAFPQPPTTILSTPQLTVTVNPSPQNPSVIQLLPPNKALHSASQVPPVSPPMPPSQHFANSESILPTKHFPAIPNTNFSPSPRLDTFDLEQMRSHNPPHLSSLPAAPLLPTPQRPQRALSSEPPVFATPPSQWPTPVSAARVKRDPFPGSWNNRSNGLLGVPAPNPHYPTNPNNNMNAFHSGPRFVQPVLPGLAGERNELLDRSELEAWSPDRSPSTPPEFRSFRGAPDLRREYGWNDRTDWSRQHNPGDRDRHNRSGRRWRNRDRRR